MKRIEIIFLFSSLLVTYSCDKYPFLPDDYSKSFLGDWNWIGTSCPFGGYYLDADSVDYTISLTFAKNGKYYRYKNDSLIISSNYHFDFDQIINDRNRYTLTVDNDPQTYQAFISSYNNKEFLVISEKVSDTCEEYFYREQ